MKILFIFGTRPEAIKLAPVITSFKQEESFATKVCITSQHKEMLKQVLDLYDITPDYDLDVMEKNQSLEDLTKTILVKLDPVLNKEKPDVVLVHGDTTTTFASSLASFYKKISIGHIEAGLRTGNIYSPWPEEGNRRLVSHLAQYHFAPTENSKENLLLEGIDEKAILVTGNTVIDSLLQTVNSLEDDSFRHNKIGKNFSFVSKQKKIILITGHRRENFGEGFNNICNSIRELAKKYPEINFVYPVHLNPSVREPVFGILNNINNIYLLEPQDYLPFVYLMNKSYIILTDSGGIQEEAPSLGKPVLLLRNTTERPEAVSAGTVKLVGTNSKKIIDTTSNLIDDIEEYKRMSKAHNPYGDGMASKRILDFFKEVRS
tara:strand:- start:942 stop:2066 length:1125 start_codon:yes stop_codon:yes gene_type:complete